MIANTSLLAGSLHLAAADPGARAVLALTLIVGGIYFAAIAVAAFVALSRLHVHRAVSTLVLASIAIQLICFFGTSRLIGRLPEFLVARGYDKEEVVPYVVGLANVANLLLPTLAFILLIFAAFGWRRSSNSQSVQAAEPSSKDVPNPRLKG